jgi:hypothetical protein
MIEIIVLLSYIGVYYFLYKHVIDMIEFTCINYDEFLEISSTKETKELPKYEDKYKKEFELAESSGTIENLKYNILMENTPNGNVLIFYDSTKDSFVYYSDKVIPYRFLDTVGRKYAIHFKCKNVYIIDKSQAKNHKSRLKIDVKECANRYMYLGKIANFSFLQKVKKNVTNKNKMNFIYE